MNTVIRDIADVKSSLDISAKCPGQTRPAGSACGAGALDGAERVCRALGAFSTEGKQTWVQFVPAWQQVAVADALIDLAGSIQVEGDVRIDLAGVPFSVWAVVDAGKIRFEAIWSSA